jgi:RNA polymerase sigma-70 factor, ECF subfamily
METLEIGHIASGMGEYTERRMSDPPAGKDRERENAEDLAIFRQFLAGLLLAGDKDAVRRAEGNHQAREAFTKIYLRYRERVYAYALRVLSNPEDAEDLFQEVFFRVYARAKTFQEERSFGGWVFTIAHNLCMNKIRDRKPLDSIEDTTLYVEPSSDFGEDWQALIAHAMSLLPVEYREVIILHEYEGLSYAEITEILHTTIPSIKSRIYRAKGKLRELLAPYYKEMEP